MKRAFIMKYKAFFIFFKGLAFKLIKATLMEGEI